jgi:hypothetical protein
MSFKAACFVRETDSIHHHLAFLDISLMGLRRTLRGLAGLPQHLSYPLRGARGQAVHKPLPFHT